MVGVLSEAHREREKTTSEKCKASMRALSFCRVGLAHTRRAHASQKMKQAKKKRYRTNNRRRSPSVARRNRTSRTR